MIAINKNKAIRCSYKNNSCREIPCPFNVFHKTEEAFLAICDIPTNRCLNIKDVIQDDEFNIAIRIWAKHVFIEKECRCLPPELVEIAK